MVIRGIGGWGRVGPGWVEPNSEPTGKGALEGGLEEAVWEGVGGREGEKGGGGVGRWGVGGVGRWGGVGGGWGVRCGEAAGGGVAGGGPELWVVRGRGAGQLVECFGQLAAGTAGKLVLASWRTE